MQYDRILKQISVDSAGNEIQTHAREIGTSVRREDDTRKRIRESSKMKKTQEKQERMEELKRLKNLKRQEMLDKISRIRQVAGIADGSNMEALDLEGEYDPLSHDTKMAAVFNESFYGDVHEDSKEKPVWDDDIDISDIVLSNTNRYVEDYAPGGEAYDPTEAGPSGKKSKSELKKESKAKKQAKHKERVIANKIGQNQDEEEQSGPDEDEELDDILDPEQRKRMVDKFMDEYYGLDYEDMVRLFIVNAKACFITS